MRNNLMKRVDVDVRVALWQYFLDHSQIQRNGFWMIRFPAKTQEDFWRRVQARFDGDFIRYKAEEKNARQQAKFDSLDIQKKKMKEWEAKILAIRNHGNWIDKFILWANRKSNNYIKTYENI